MNELINLSIKEALLLLKKKELSPIDLIDAHINEMEGARSLNLFITETADLAREAALSSEKNYNTNEARPLEGIPFGIKDMFCTKDIRTTASSKMLENFVPPYESTVTKNLWDDGAILLGKLNNDEFAMGSSNETSFF